MKERKESQRLESFTFSVREDEERRDAARAKDKGGRGETRATDSSCGRGKCRRRLGSWLEPNTKDIIGRNGAKGQQMTDNSCSRGKSQSKLRSRQEPRATDSGCGSRVGLGARA